MIRTMFLEEGSTLVSGFFAGLYCYVNLFTQVRGVEAPDKCTDTRGDQKRIWDPLELGCYHPKSGSSERAAVLTAEPPLPRCGPECDRLLCWDHWLAPPCPAYAVQGNWPRASCQASSLPRKLHPLYGFFVQVFCLRVCTMCAM